MSRTRRVQIAQDTFGILERVVFAVLDRSSEKSIFNAFQSAFTS